MTEPQDMQAGPPKTLNEYEIEFWSSLQMAQFKVTVTAKTAEDAIAIAEKVNHLGRWSPEGAGRYISSVRALP